ncbi:MAG: recombination mediator RecR [Patescibacteria group bacterium]
MIPRPIQRLIDDFQKLPGIGPKSAQRLAFYTLRMPATEVEKFAQNLIKAKSDVTMCSICKNIDESNPCSLCTNSTRQENIIAVVSTPLDLVSMERAGFKGKYHVLHGIIDPLNGIGPEELYIDDLVTRFTSLTKSSDVIPELILALSTSLEGESTALYISRLVRAKLPADKVKMTRLARGLPVGGDVEYADEVTLSKALEGRVSM